MKRINPFSISVFVLAAFAGLAFLLASGCHSDSTSNSQSSVTAPMAKITPISNCVVDSENDVEIGGPNAKPGCNTVKMEPSLSNPSSFDEIAINNGGKLIIDGSNNLETKTAKATRSISFTGNYQETPVSEICVGNGGELSFTNGTTNAPITSENKVRLTFDDKASGLGSKDICPNFHHKGIDVLAGGSLIMNGAKGVPAYGGVSWTTLAAPAGSNVPGAKVQSTGLKTLHLTADVTKGKGPKGENEGWQSGDWIVVATTDYDPFHSEFVQIDNVTSNPNPGCANSVQGCSTVTLIEPLKYYHFGSLPPSSATATCPDPLNGSKTQPAFLCDGPDRNYGVDERAEVGLISRDIELTSTTESDNPHRGGEIMIHHGFKKVEIQGVRLSKFGKDNLGSYPIHFHLVGDITKAPNPGTANVLVNADSVDHSYNKCVTIHATSNLTISNLVCARIMGHIFYEELQSTSEINPANDSGIVFNHDLGIGAMSNSFDIYATSNMTRKQLIDKYWWAGDYMTNAQCSTYDTCINYDGFNIPDTDNGGQATHGFCYSNIDSNTGMFYGGNFPPCNPGQYYIEPASGFWIQNPGTTLTNDAIAGCQGDGVSYWWVPPDVPIKVGTSSNSQLVDLRYNPLGQVKDDRASACYHAYFAEGENNLHSGQLTPLQNGENTAAADSPNIITHFDGLTATHIRWRAFWLRGTAAWFVLENGHFADDNRGATMLTSGGVDGNAPGIWDLVKDSVFVGESQDNVGRWGPCPKTNALGTNTGWQYGCIDYSHPQSGAHSGEVNGKGYPWPFRNSYGYQIYDGPPLIFHDRFVNFNYDTPNGNEFSSELDDADRQALYDWQQNNSTSYKHYEGDAAFGWFPANQNAYPTATATKQLIWTNTNLRHQIFTDHVKIDNTFGDGDKNTAVIDEDGTLTDFGVQRAPNSGTAPVHAISLNNLPFNTTSNSVDECFSRGAQDEAVQGRDSSLISPAEMGTLEFSNLYPWAPGAPNGSSWPGANTSHWQQMTFTRTDTIRRAPPPSTARYHPFMTLNSRAGQGTWEPKVSNGYGYSVTVAPTKIVNGFPPSNQVTGKSGIWKWIDVGLADVIDPNLSASHPFYIRLGIDYASVDSQGNVHIPTDNFTIKRGYKSYYGGVFYTGKTFPDGKNNDIFNYWTQWENCHGLDGSRTLLSVPNIPIKGGPGCPAGGTNLPAVMTLSSAGSISALTDSNGNPVLDKYYYDPNTGYLWLNVVQDEPNAQGPSPIGSCDPNFDNGHPDPDCRYSHGESYYVCPKNGCIIYTISMNDPNYTPGPSPSTAVLPPAAADLKPAPSNPNKLVMYGTSTVIVPKVHEDKFTEPYNTASTAGPICSTTQP